MKSKTMSSNLIWKVAMSFVDDFERREKLTGKEVIITE